MSEAPETNAFDAEELNFDDFQLEDFEAESTLQQEPATAHTELCRRHTDWRAMAGRAASSARASDTQDTGVSASQRAAPWLQPSRSRTGTSPTVSCPTRPST